MGPRCLGDSSDFDVDLLLVLGGLFLTCYCFRHLQKEKGMGLEDGGSGLGGHCLATRHCGQLLQCHFGHEEVGAAGLLKRLSVLILIFLF